MRDSLKRRLAALEQSREPKAADHAEYIVAAYSTDPEKALSRLPPPRKGSLVYAMINAFARRNAEK